MAHFIKHGLPAKYCSSSFGSNQAAARQRLKITARLTAYGWIAGQARNDKGERKYVSKMRRVVARVC